MWNRAFAVVGTLVGLALVAPDGADAGRGDRIRAKTGVSAGDGTMSSETDGGSVRDDTGGGLRYSVMVSEVRNHATGWEHYWDHSRYGDLSAAVAAVLTGQLHASDRFVTIGGIDARRDALVEQDFGVSGRVAGGKKQAEVGRLTPAQLLVRAHITTITIDAGGSTLGGISIPGTASRFDFKSRTSRITMTIHMIDATTGVVTASENVTGVAKQNRVSVRNLPLIGGGRYEGLDDDNLGSALLDCLADAVRTLEAQLDAVQWEGTIVSADRPTRVIINRGLREGVSVGQHFTVGESETISDPDTGELLYVDLHAIGTLEVVDVEEKIAFLRVIDVSSPVAEGMTVIPSGS